MAQLELHNTNSVSRTTLFADIILPLAVPKKYTYRVPYALNDKVDTGYRVVVQFGKRKVYTGIVANIHEKPPENYEAKSILSVMDEYPVITETQLKLFAWLSEYYMCTLGEVVQAALPSGLKINSESKIQIHPLFEEDKTEYDFSTDEHKVLEALRNNPILGYSETSKIIERKEIYQIIKSLTQKGAIIVFEQVSEKYSPKREKRVILAKEFRHEDKLKELLNTLSNKEKQENIVLGYYQGLLEGGTNIQDTSGLPLSYFNKAEYSTSSLNTLVKKGFFEKVDIIVPRIKITEKYADINLSEDQQKASAEILNAFEKNKPVLLHGITGSGKTEIYIDLINKVIESGQQVLFLLPEIAITTQIISRLYKAYGNAFGVYHSKYSDNERVEIWNGVLDESIKFVVGVRSSVFLPFQNLGLIIVDEEHETSYKQHQPSPRYHARDVSLMMGKFNHCPVLMGTATPSMESYFNALTGKYTLVEIFKRYGNSSLPEFNIIDIAREKKKKQAKGEFSNRLINELKEQIEKKNQAILFQNRRGYSPIINCDDCNWTAKCIQCSVSLTYHQFRQELKCHYCGYTEPVPVTCPDCGSNKVLTIGFGTQKLEEDLNLLLPEANVARMDLDTTRSRNAYDQIINSFEKNEINILVGTQIVTKGLDFDRVKLVGIVDFDRMINYPDFRSMEKAFQLSVQVAGRAGRREEAGKVILQTKDPEKSILRHIVQNDWQEFYKEEVKERENFHYPPFTRLIKISIKHKDASISEAAARDLKSQLHQRISNVFILGPEPGIIYKIRNQYIFEILIKIYRNDLRLQDIKNTILETNNLIYSQRKYSGLRIVNDADPQ